MILTSLTPVFARPRILSVRFSLNGPIREQWMTPQCRCENGVIGKNTQGKLAFV